MQSIDFELMGIANYFSYASISNIYIYECENMKQKQPQSMLIIISFHYPFVAFNSVEKLIEFSYIMRSIKMQARRSAILQLLFDILLYIIAD